MEEIKHLMAVVDSIKAHGTPGNPEAAEWFLQGISDYMRSQEYQTLDKVFGLNSKRGTPTQRTRYMKDIRNMYLRRAYDCTAPDKPATTRCDILAQEIRRFDRIYFSWKQQGGPPDLCSELRRNLYHAKDTGQELPRKYRYIFNLVHGY